MRISTAVLAGVMVLTGAAAFAAPGDPETDTTLEPVGSRTAEQQRTESDPDLASTPAERPRADEPIDRYDLAGGCYVVSAGDRWLRQSGAELTTTTDPGAATPLHFQATELGRYLLFAPDETFVARSGSDIGLDAAPSEDAEWTIDETDGGFAIGDEGEALAVDESAVAAGDATAVGFRREEGCARWDEVEVNVDGPVFTGTSPLQEVRGYLDDHIHHMTQDFLGGSIHCGQPWHPYGVKYALKDCPDHSATLGRLALPEIVLSGKIEHDHVGWPTFNDWPAPDSLTHEGTYYKWVERAWRGGQRLWVNLLVENSVLCAVYPGDNLDCTDMNSIRIQAQQSRDFENYVDAQWGGPGEGWYRLVDDPAEAREVINDGKLAVVLGTESSTLFGCSIILDSPTCDTEAVTEGLDELHALGIRQMVPTHKFDNAFSGVKGDEGTNGIVTNAGNFIHTGSFIRMQECEEGAPGPDNPQLGPDDIPDERLGALIGTITGAVADVPLPIALPIYGSGDQCNTRGLTDMGRFMIDEMVERTIIYDVDHMSAKGRSEALDVFEEIEYPGVISSHSWSDPTALPRIYALGGMVNPYAGNSETFVGQWDGLLDDMDGRFYWGLGYGADTNGLGAQGDPRGADAENPVEYPFDGMGGVQIDHQHSGERTYDINVDGVAHYGLYPDWIEDLRQLAGQDIHDDLVRGPEAYLQMWERATGIANDACREPDLRRQADDFTAIETGTTSQAVLQEFGQPHLRRDDTYRYCALDGDAAAGVTVTFDGTDVASVSTSATPDTPNSPDPDVPAPADATPAAADPGADAGTGTGAAGSGSVDVRADGELPEAGGPGFGRVLAALAAIVVGVAMIASTQQLRVGARSQN